MVSEYYLVRSPSWSRLRVTLFVYSPLHLGIQTIQTLCGQIIPLGLYSISLHFRISISVWTWDIRHTTLMRQKSKMDYWKIENYWIRVIHAAIDRFKYIEINRYLKSILKLMVEYLPNTRGLFMSKSPICNSVKR
jgi:hypothetical protein